jgi:CRP-like cAMP-binding protein
MAKEGDGQDVSTMRRFQCEHCRLRKLELFREFTKDELNFVSDFKSGELNVEKGTVFLSQGASNAHVYTVLQGWAFRYKDLDDGRRQVLNYVFPGDLVGLQGAVLSEMEHSVAAMSDMVLCIFERRKLTTLYESCASLAYDVTWLAAREEQLLESHLLTVGRRTAVERIAYLILYIHERSARVGMAEADSFDMPLTQQHIADTLGLSLVHTNKTMRRLHRDELISWKKNRMTILDRDGLMARAKWDPLPARPRPFI